jgi:hypothetical protein
MYYMKDYRLSSEQIAELEKRHRCLRDKRQADRVKAVIALAKGWSAAQVAEILLFDEKTSRQYFQQYQNGAFWLCWMTTIPGRTPSWTSIK